jgi:cell division protease FtsH
MFVGVGASRVRDLFAQGKKNAPCLIFIDEIDAVGRQRGAGLGGGHDEREQTLNQLLVEMDGFEANEGVILSAATNRPDVLDPALQRPGRFDRQVVVPPPDIRGRKHILEVHSKRTPLAHDVNLDTLAKGTPGFSGADLENLVNEAALTAAKENKDSLSMLDFENAKDKLLMGKERRTLVQTPEDLKTTAYHEAGHAIVNLLLPETDTLHKVSIIPRGRALGVTMYLPEEDKNSLSKVELESKITMAFGGRAAELIVFNKMTTGAANDIKQASGMARSMVCKWGMSDLIGPISIGEQNQEVFIGREWVTNRDHSEETSRQVDAEVKRIIDAAMREADRLLRENMDCLHRMAESLLDRETITGDEAQRLMRGETLPPLDLKTNPRKIFTTKDLAEQRKNEAQTPPEDQAGVRKESGSENEEEGQGPDASSARKSDAASPLGAALSTPKKDAVEKDEADKNEKDVADRQRKKMDE